MLYFNLRAEKCPIDQGSAWEKKRERNLLPKWRLKIDWKKAQEGGGRRDLDYTEERKKK